MESDAPEAVDRWRELGAWLRQSREAKGLDRLAFARESGVSVMTLQTLESGGRNIYQSWVLPNPRHSVLSRIADALGEPHELLATLTSRARAGDPLEVDEVRRRLALRAAMQAAKTAGREDEMKAVQVAVSEALMASPAFQVVRIATKAERLSPEARTKLESIIDSYLEDE